MKHKTEFLNNWSLSAFMKRLPHFTKKQFQKLASSMTTGGMTSFIKVPVSFSDREGPYMNHDGLTERHPGWWFKDGFTNLSKEEKAASLELLTLAKASAPDGIALFCSVPQLSAWLGVDETSLFTVLSRAMKKWLVEIQEMVLIPVPDNSLKLRRIEKANLPKSALKLLEVNSSKIARFYLIVFPGFHADSRGPLEQRLGSIWEKETGYSQCSGAELNALLDEPYRLLEEMLDAGKASGYRTRVEIESPRGNPSTIRLPWPPLYHIGSHAEIEQRLSRDYWPLLPISKSDAAKAAVRLLFARFNLMAMFAQHLGIANHESIPVAQSNDDQAKEDNHESI